VASCFGRSFRRIIDVTNGELNKKDPKMPILHHDFPCDRPYLASLIVAICAAANGDNSAPPGIELFAKCSVYEREYAIQASISLTSPQHCTEYAVEIGVGIAKI
jgi:hypothetical protein